jgi:hypothetical protein
MDDLLQLLARWRGIPVADGQELRFEFARFPTGGLGLLVLLGLALAVGFVVFVYRRDAHSRPRAVQLLLAGLRALAVAVVAAILLEPSLVAIQRQTRPGHVLLLVDSSQSMAQKDGWRKPEAQAAADGWRGLGVADLRAASRLDLVRALLGHGDGELVRTLAARNDVQLYAFAGALDQLPLLPAVSTPTSPTPPPTPPPTTNGAPAPAAAASAPRVDLARLAADGRASNLGGTLRTALDKSRNAEIAAVVFVTDGRRNAGPQAAEVARLLGQRKIPHVFALGVGDPSATQSVQLARFEAPAKVFQRDPFEAKATVFAQGYDAAVATVRLLRVDDKGQEQVVRTQPLALAGDGETAVEWKDLVADAPGRFTYRAEVAPPDGEPLVPERHARTAPVEVLDERLRLLLVAGGASHEFQILRNLLLRDKTIDVSCWLQSADPKFPQDGDDGARIERLPEERAEFDPYDVVVLLDPDASKLTPRFCQHLQQHVVEGGCGLWWVAGEKFTLDAVRPAAVTAPLAELLPVAPDLDAADRGAVGLGKAFRLPWPLQLAPEGEDGLGAKLTRLLDDRDGSRTLWQRLPGQRFVFPVAASKPVATVLAEHAGPEQRRNGRGMPVFAVQNVGAGRVVWSGFDETYRWRSLYEAAYNRFWVGGVRYLFEGRAQAGNARLRLFVSDDKVDLGDAVELAAEAKDEALQPLVADAFAVVVERDGEAPETLQLPPVEAAPGRYALRLRPQRLGAYRVRAADKQGRAAEAAFQVVAAQYEREGPMDRAELAAITAGPGGVLCETPQQLLAALATIPSRAATDTWTTPHPLWDGWPTLAFVLAVLAVEWLLRKRSNLL